MLLKIFLSLKGLIIICFFLTSSLSSARELRDRQITTQMGTYQFNVSNPTSGDESVSGIGTYSMMYGVPAWEKFYFFGGASLLLSQGFKGSTALGFDMGARYYHWTRAGITRSERMNAYIELNNAIRPYIGVGVRSREFLSTLSSTYIGAGAIVGADFEYKKDLFFNAEIRYDSLKGPNSVFATQINFMFGIGVHI